MGMTGMGSIWLFLLALAAVLVILAVTVGRIPLRYNVRNLIVRWRTTMVTAMAFTSVVFLLVAMLAFVKGMYKLTDGSGQPGNIILLSQGATDEAFSNLGFSDTGDIERQPGILRDTDGRLYCSKETYIVVNQPIPNALAAGPKRRFVQVRGIEDPQMSGAVHAVKLYDGGRWFSPAGVQSLDPQQPIPTAPIPTTPTPSATAAESPDKKPAEGAESEKEEANSEPTVSLTGESTAIEAVLGEGVAGELGRDPDNQKLASVQKFGRLDTGDNFSLGGRTWRVVGVMKSAGSTFDSEVWAKRQLVGQMFGKVSYTSIIVRGENVATAKRLTKYYNDEFKKAAVQAQLETDYFSSLSKTNEQFLYAIIFVTVFMAIGGVFGVTNTMLAAVAQRSKDIGVLRIIGYSGWQVLLCFLIESLFLALAGGALGCLMGLLVNGMTATSIVGNAQGGGKSVVLQLIVDSDIIIKCMAVSLAMGLLGGIYPAITTFRARPLETLR